ncbi:MAG: hypothetical protein ACTSYS_06360, partial [Promethearchaeota archaeon]
MVQSEKRLKVVDHEDKKIIIEYGDFITVALVVNKDLKIYHEKLKIFVNNIEYLFKPYFLKWDGEITKFNEGLTKLTKLEFRDKIDPYWWFINKKKARKRRLQSVPHPKLESEDAR